MTDLERLKLYDEEISKEMPEDFKDFWENSKEEWPLVTRLVLEGRRENLEWCYDVIDKQALKIKDLEEKIKELEQYNQELIEELAGEDL
jgi:cephalosporin-C deacetylase-like acetyl esterase